MKSSNCKFVPNSNYIAGVCYPKQLDTPLELVLPAELEVDRIFVVWDYNNKVIIKEIFASTKFKEDCVIKVFNFIVFNLTKVTNINFSQDGKYCVTGHEDCSIRVWNLPTFDRLKEIRYPLIKVISPPTAHGIREIVFSSNNELFASIDRDNIVKVWSTQFFSCIHTQPMRTVLQCRMTELTYRLKYFVPFLELHCFLLM